MKINEIHVDENDILRIFDGDGTKHVDYKEFKRIMNEETTILSTRSSNKGFL